MSRPQLTTYSKAILLMHRHKYVREHVPGNKMSATEFFKYLLISRQFLRASQLYQVYFFVIYKYCKIDKKFDVATVDRSGFGPPGDRLKLKLKEIKALNRLLNAQYVVLLRYEYKYAKEFSAVCKIFTGHILLILSDDVDAAKKHIKIIKQVQKQLHSLLCDVKSLIASSDMPQLDLPNCEIHIKNFYQFKQVIGKHRIKGLAIGNDSRQAPSFDEAIDKNFFNDFPTCPSVDTLICSWRNLNVDHDLVLKVTKMVPFFPKLRVLCCDFTADHYTPAQFTKAARLDKKRMQEGLKSCKKTKLPITEVAIKYEFKIRKTESPKVMKQVLKEILKTTKFDRFRMADCVIRNSGNLLDKPYCDLDLRWFSLKFHVILKFTVDLDPRTLDDIEPPEDFDD
ncbi:hypothetical protein M3Y95_00440000 [Aphelenchoides besseyi]|nr:hypothetical protein M3Y95_00440000 [Aphelenchoides besseyi]